jgi:acyl-CoA thioester hydrolase
MPGEHSLDIRVYYEDTDAGGIVYHASYLKFAERGRTELLRDIGFNHADLLKQAGTSFAVISMEIKFKAPARLDDLLTVHTRVTDIKGASMGMTQEIRRGDVSLVDIDLRVACLDHGGKAARLPSELRKLFD